jgi:uncharacterized OB-fold protein
MTNVDPELSRQLQFDRCAACGHWQATDRACCGACNRTSALECKEASGRAIVHAVTVVSRGPSDAFHSLEPYTIVLARTVEGPLLMGHALTGAAIGDHVVASLLAFADTQVLRFVPAELPRTSRGAGK